MAVKLKFVTGTKRLQENAAYSWRRMGRAGMPSSRLESSYRTWDSQMALYKKYKAGKGNFALHPSKSNHVKGVAVDSHDKQQAWLKKHGKRYGWYPVKNEPWHFDYVREKDTVRTAVIRLRAVRDALGRPLLWKASKKRRMAGQRVLAKYGYYDGEIDGIVGPKTKAGYARLVKDSK